MATMSLPVLAFGTDPVTKMLSFASSVSPLAYAYPSAVLPYCRIQSCVPFVLIFATVINVSQPVAFVDGKFPLTMTALLDWHMRSVVRVPPYPYPPIGGLYVQVAIPFVNCVT